MRIVTWNTRKAINDLSSKLNWIDRHHNPDILLIQESGNPKMYFPKSSEWKTALWNPKIQHKQKDEGNAILSQSIRGALINVGSLQGWLEIASFDLPCGSTAIANIHAPTDTKDHAAFGVSPKTCGSWLMNFAMPQIMEITSGFDNWIIGGDTNCSRTISDRLNRKIYRQAHEAMVSQFGFVEAMFIGRPANSIEAHDEISTWRRSKNVDWTVPNDHFFVKGNIEKHVVGCKVATHPDPPSDHAPVILELSF